MPGWPSRDCSRFVPPEIESLEEGGRAGREQRVSAGLRGAGNGWEVRRSFLCRDPIVADGDDIVLFILLLCHRTTHAFYAAL